MRLLPPLHRMKWWLATVQVVVAYVLLSLAWWRQSRFAIQAMDALNDPGTLLLGNGSVKFSIWWESHFGLASWPFLLRYEYVILYASWLLWFLVGYLIELQLLRPPQPLRTVLIRDLLLIALGLLTGPLYGIPALDIAPYGKVRMNLLATFFWFLFLLVTELSI